MHHLRGIRLLNNSVLSKNIEVYKLIAEIKVQTVHMGSWWISFSGG